MISARARGVVCSLVIPNRFSVARAICAVDAGLNQDGRDGSYR
jgi:hypothetical protein